MCIRDRCCLVCCMLSCQFADIPILHRAPMNPSGQWHWNAPSTLIHVPPFWHGLVLPLAHSSMSEKKNTMGAWSVSLLWCIFLKGLIADLLSGTEAKVVSTQTSNPNIYRERIVFPIPVLLPSLHFRIYSQAFIYTCLTIYVSLYSKRLLFCVRFFAIGVNLVILLKIWRVLYNVT